MLYGERFATPNPRAVGGGRQAGVRYAFVDVIIAIMASRSPLFWCATTTQQYHHK